VVPTTLALVRLTMFGASCTSEFITDAV